MILIIKKHAQMHDYLYHDIPGLKLQYCIDNAFHLPVLPVRLFVHQQIRILAFYIYIYIDIYLFALNYICSVLF